RFRAIAAGGDHTCAIGTDAALYCWGSDAHGALRGVAPDRCNGEPCGRTPTRLARSVTSVDVGFGVTCIRRANHLVRCWGDGEPALALDGADDSRAEISPRSNALEGSGAALARVRWKLDAAQRFLYRT